MQQAGRNGTGLMLVSREDWIELDLLHSHVAVFRAIENGISFVRQPDEALSIAVEPYGRVLAQTDFFGATDWTIEAQGLMYVGLLSHHLGDDRAAQAYSQQTLRLMPNLELGWAVDLIHVFTVLGHALAGLGHPTEAAENYWQGLTMRRERGQHHLAVEPLAGLARVTLAQEDPAGALVHADEILDYMEDHPALAGTLDPLRIYLTCYRVLQANRDARASEILDAAYHLLQERAATIEDEDLRRSYLENVPHHRELIALWKKQNRLSASRAEC